MESIANQIILFEKNQLSENGVIDLFSNLIKSKLVNRLQGSYKRHANDYINAGYLNEDGEILNYPDTSQLPNSSVGRTTEKPHACS